MTSQEKDQLLALLLDARHWCQAVEARTDDGQAVTYSDPAATAWDVTGAACHLFGWRRACALFIQIERHIHPRGRAGLAGREAEIAAMVGLQDWNDDAHTTHAELLTRLERLPVSTRSGNGQEVLIAAGDGELDRLSTGVLDTTPSSAPDNGPDGSGA